MRIILLCASVSFLLGSCTKNTTSNTDCSTVSVTYKTNMQPLVSSKCATTGCHNASSKNGDLTTYSGLFAKYQSGDLKREVVTNKTMPQNGSLSTAELQQFECWINAGAPNN